MQLAVLGLAMIALLSFVGECMAADKLLQSTDMTYLGAFRLPLDPDHGGGTLWWADYAAHGLAFRPPAGAQTRGSLYIAGYDQLGKVAEIGIPDTLSSAPATSLPRASLVQPLTDILGLTRKRIYTGNNYREDSNVQIGGMLVYGGQLVGTVYDFYKYSSDQERSHFTAPLTLSDNSATGVYQPSEHSRMVAGHMANVPASWQSALGGPVLTGLHDISIIADTSYLPTAFSFDPASLSMAAPFTVTPLMYVPSTAHHTVYGYWLGNGPPDPVITSADSFGGVVFPTGSKSVLFIGTHGTGEQCYGEQTLNPALHGIEICGETGTEKCCYDPEAGKGTHAYPYVYQVWAYNAEDLARVKAGTLAHNSVVPYAIWHLTPPQAPTTSHVIYGAAYDESTQRVYISQGFTEGAAPVIQVYQLNLSPSSPPPTGTTRSLNGRLSGKIH